MGQSRLAHPMFNSPLTAAANCVQVQLSYLEIYAEGGYDLLDPQRDGDNKAGLAHVVALEDEEHEI